MSIAPTRFKEILGNRTLLQVYTLINVYTAWSKYIHTQLRNISPPTTQTLCNKIKDYQTSYYDMGNFLREILQPLTEYNLIFWQGSLPKGLCLPTPLTMEFIRELENLDSSAQGSNEAERFWNKLKNAFEKLDEKCSEGKNKPNSQRAAIILKKVNDFLQRHPLKKTRNPETYKDTVHYLYSVLLYFCDSNCFPDIQDLDIDIVEVENEKKPCYLKLLKLYVSPESIEGIMERKESTAQQLDGMGVDVKFYTNPYVIEIIGNTWTDVMEVGKCLTKKGQ